VEVKSESDTGAGQLARYRKLLKDSGFPSTALILLTRYPVNLSPEEEQPDFSVRWYQIAEWIEQERRRYSFRPVSDFLVNQFLAFLGARNMTMGQVTWELSGGIRALRSLTDMLYEAAAACGLKGSIRGDRNYLGVYLDHNKYWIGVYFERPEFLIFENLKSAMNKEEVKNLGWTMFQDESGCFRELNLESEEVHFFARSRASQIQVLEKYLRECLELAKRIEVPGADADTPPNSEADMEG
jgi:hypothetical protein